MNKLAKRSLSFVMAMFVSIMSIVTNIPTSFASNPVKNVSETHDTDDVTLLVGSQPTDPNGKPYFTDGENFSSIADAIKKYDSDFALGIASQFSVFLTGDFIPHESDAEGRVAVGGNIDASGYPYDSYNIGKGHYVNKEFSVDLEKLLLGNNDFATLIWGAESDSPVLSPVVNQKNSQKIAVQTDAGVKYVKDNFASRLNEFYGADLLNIQNEMDKLQKKSNKLAGMKNQFKVEFFDLANPNPNVVGYTYGSDGSKAKIAYVTYTGDATKPTDTVYFNLDELTPEEYKQFKESSIIRFENIPKLETPRTVSQVDKAAGEIPTEVNWEYSYIVVNDSRDGDVTFGYRHPTKDGWNINYYTSIKGYDADLPDGDGKAFNISRIGSDGDNPNPNPWIEYNPRNGEFDYKLKKHSGAGDATNAQNNEAGVTSLLYNFPNADRVIVCCNVQGTILAPGAHITDLKFLKDDLPDGWTIAVDEGENAHISGAVIASSFEGNIEFGYRPFTGPISMLGTTAGYALALSKLGTVLDEKGKPVLDENGEPKQEPLAGATFVLVKESKDEEGNKIETIVSEVETTGKAYDFITIPTSIDFDGGKEYKIGDQVETIYTLREEKAPAEYDKTTRTYKIKIVGTIQDLTTNSDGKKIPNNVKVEVYRSNAIEDENTEIEYTLIRDLSFADAYVNDNTTSKDTLSERKIEITSPIKWGTDNAFKPLPTTFTLTFDENGNVTKIVEEHSGYFKEETYTKDNMDFSESHTFTGTDNFTYYYDAENLMITRIPSEVPTFVNTEKEIKLVKVDFDERNIVLPGAEIEVYSVENEKEPVVIGTTVEDGTISLEHLPVGRYYIKEIKAPEKDEIKYDLPVNEDNRIYFTINKDYTISRDEFNNYDISYTINYKGIDAKTFDNVNISDEEDMSVQGIEKAENTVVETTNLANDAINFYSDYDGKKIEKIIIEAKNVKWGGGLQFKPEGDKTVCQFDNCFNNGKTEITPNGLSFGAGGRMKISYWNMDITSITYECEEMVDPEAELTSITIECPTYLDGTIFELDNGRDAHEHQGTVKNGKCTIDVGHTLTKLPTLKIADKEESRI
ncbi:MAG: choice-of-anchor A family protein, partial [Ruminococcus sp.]|nr:choice-of-anchor A family protein [Ruminococcus sp.]